MKIISSLFLIILVQSLTAFADDKSARRYPTVERDEISRKYFLLSTKRVQDSLKLTPEQIESLKAVMLSSPTNLPGIMELRRTRKQLLAVAHSEQERTKIKRAENAQANLLIHQNWEQILQSTLAPDQTKRLAELFLQMQGPNAILENTKVVRALNLSTNQIIQFTDVAKSYEPFLSLLRKRYLGQQLQPVRPEDPAESESELTSLDCVIREVEKDRDAEFLAILNESQRLKWNDLCGLAVPINWIIFQMCRSSRMKQTINNYLSV